MTYYSIINHKNILSSIYQIIMIAYFIVMSIYLCTINNKNKVINKNVFIFTAEWSYDWYKFKKEWNNLKKTLENNSINYYELDAIVYEDEIDELNITEFPTIIIQKDDTIYKYDGNLTRKGLLKEFGIDE